MPIKMQTPLTENHKFEAFAGYNFSSPSDEKRKYLSELLSRYYDLDIPSASIFKWDIKTTASNLFCAFSHDGKCVLLKESFWYRGNPSINSKTVFEKICELSEALRTRGVVLPRYYRSRSQKFVDGKDNIDITVADFIYGTKFPSSDQQYESSAQALGRFHYIGSKYLEDYPDEVEATKQNIPIEKPYEESRKIYFEELRNILIKQHSCFWQEVCQAVRENISLIDDIIQYIDDSNITGRPLTVGILHNDFHPDNVTFDADGKVISIFDIDQLGIGPFIWDVGTSVVSFIWKSKIDGVRFGVEDKTKTFLKNYHNIFLLPIPEYELILAASQRWDIMRVLRILRRHHYEGDRLSYLLPKVKDFLIPRIKFVQSAFAFIDKNWTENVLLRNSPKF